MNKRLMPGYEGEVRPDFSTLEFYPGRVVNRTGNAKCNVAGHIPQRFATESGLDKLEANLLDDLAHEDLLELVELFGIALQLHFDYPACLVNVVFTSANVSTSVVD